MSVLPQSQPEACCDDEFEQLYRELHPRILAYARKHFGADAEDVAAETMMRAMEASRGPAPLRAPLAWMLVVAHRVGCDIQRRKTRAVPRDPSDFGGLCAPDHLGPEGTLLSREAATLLDQALQGLSPDDRSLLRLRLVEGLSHDQIAEALGSTPLVVRKKFSRARQRLVAGLTAVGQDLKVWLPTAAAAALVARLGRRGKAATTVTPQLLQVAAVVGALAVGPTWLGSPFHDTPAPGGASLLVTPAVPTGGSRVVPVAHRPPIPVTAQPPSSTPQAERLEVDTRVSGVTVRAELAKRPLDGGQTDRHELAVPTPVGTVVVEGAGSNSGPSGIACAVPGVVCSSGPRR